MSLNDTLENFIKYKEHLDDLDRDDTESSATVETYEKQFMVRYSIRRFDLVIPEACKGI